jgi:hypothetical protein
MGLTIRVGALGGSKLLIRFKGRCEDPLAGLSGTSQQLVKRSKVLLILATLGFVGDVSSRLLTELLLTGPMVEADNRHLGFRSDSDNDDRFPRRFPLRLPLTLQQ